VVDNSESILTLDQWLGTSLAKARTPWLLLADFGPRHEPPVVHIRISPHGTFLLRSTTYPVKAMALENKIPRYSHEAWIYRRLTPLFKKKQLGITQNSHPRPAVELKRSLVKVVHPPSCGRTGKWNTSCTGGRASGFWLPKPMTAASWAEVCGTEAVGAITVQ
jgi:hypothetical protein